MIVQMTMRDAYFSMHMLIIGLRDQVLLKYPQCLVELLGIEITFAQLKARARWVGFRLNTRVNALMACAICPSSPYAIPKNTLPPTLRVQTPGYQQCSQCTFIAIGYSSAVSI